MISPGPATPQPFCSQITQIATGSKRRGGFIPRDTANSKISRDTRESCPKLWFLRLWGLLAAGGAVTLRMQDKGGYPLLSSRFFQRGVGRVIGEMIAAILFHSQPDQNRQHNEADDPSFLSCEKEHQLRRGFT
jgi:hypothetical protein